MVHNSYPYRTNIYSQSEIYVHGIVPSSIFIFLFVLLTFIHYRIIFFTKLYIYIVTVIINECSDKLPEPTFMGNFIERITNSTKVSGGPGQMVNHDPIPYLYSD